MNESKFIEELRFKSVRSGGPGGQHANKVSTRVVVSFDIWRSQSLSNEEKWLIANKLGNRINKEGVLILSCDTTRSQFQNKRFATDRIRSLVQGALRKEKVRRSTKTPNHVKTKRSEAKKRHSAKKQSRRKPDID